MTLANDQLPPADEGRLDLPVVPLVENRRVLQADGKHPAPCARFCEATAFNIELRNARADIERLRSLLRAALPSLDACCPTQTALLRPPNDHEIPALLRCIRSALAERHNVGIEPPRSGRPE
jgi:hypothetical protein